MQTNLHISRRSVVLSLAGLVAFAPTMASALTEVQASQLIDKVVLDLNRIISSGKSEVGMYPDFERLFNTYADVPIIAQSALGVQWRSASSSQQSAYIAAFRTYMARKYGKRFREFIGGKITVTGLKKFTWGYLVNSTANLPGSSPFALDWQVSDKSGASKMFNIYIEGISLLATERTEIGAMLDKRNGDLNRLIADLKAM
ncbi:MAG: ABC transporter substrate-binding protein [Rhodobacterales bacterium]|jgi:phospholipid transport system substrate-binding protein|nr:ABC transporter substrate-binding protein [Pseudomonadota bacterium]NQW14138.1 ABC transporter substrate-binding protein [Rhodobacter sp.]